MKLLQDTCRNTGTTVIVITHNLAIAPMADRVIEINNAKVRKMVINPSRYPLTILNGKEKASMKKRALWKDIFREIGHTKARFISIFAIIMLGVSFLPESRPLGQIC